MVKMGDDDFFEKRRTFKMENNILIGQELTAKPQVISTGELILNKLKSKPDFVAQIDGLTNEKSTCREMRERSVKCAIWLKKHGIKSGDIVAICTHNHINTFVPCFASMYIGAAMAPLNQNLTVDTARYFIKILNPKIIFASAVTVDTIVAALKCESREKNTPLVVFENSPGHTTLKDIFESQSDAEVEEFQCTKITDPLHPTMILHSSGTTGLPKAAILTNARIFWPETIRDLGLRPNTVVLWYSPLFWVMSGILMVNTLLLDSRRIIYPEFDEERTCELIEKYNVNWVLHAATMLSRLVDSKVLLKYKLPSLQWIATGGALTSKEVLTRCMNMLPHVAIQQCYGMTESGTIAAQEKRSKVGSVGTVARGVKLKVISTKTGEILGPNQQGEICVQTPTVMLGYLNNPEAMKQTIDGEGWLHTGDLGYFNEEGDIFILDRLKELIKYRGFHIVPAEIENFMMTHPSISEVAVVSIPHPIDEEHPVAFVVKKEGYKVTEQELIDLVANNFEDYKGLRGGVVFLDKLPTTPTGKIARTNLKLQARGMNGQTATQVSG